MYVMSIMDKHEKVTRKKKINKKLKASKDLMSVFMYSKST